MIKKKTHEFIWIPSNSRFPLNIIGLLSVLLSPMSKFPALNNIYVITHSLYLIHNNLEIMIPSVPPAI